MNGGWSTKDVSRSASEAISGVVTNRVISLDAFPLTSGGAIDGLVIKIVATGVTVVGAITAKLQTAIGSDWVDSKTASITVAGNVYIKLLGANSSDWTFLPLLNQARVVVTTTNAGDAVSITAVDILQQV